MRRAQVSETVRKEVRSLSDQELADGILSAMKIMRRTMGLVGSEVCSRKTDLYNRRMAAWYFAGVTEWAERSNRSRKATGKPLVLPDELQQALYDEAVRGQ